MQSDREARIRERAYQLWLVEGRVHGRHEAHWQQAEREIAAEDSQTGETTDPPMTSEASPITVSKARAEEPATQQPAQPSTAAPARRSRQRAPAEPRG